MKLQSKSLLIIGLAGLLLIGFILISPKPLNILNLVLVIACCMMAIGFSIHYFIIKRIEAIQKHFNLNDVRGQDETLLIDKTISDLKETLKETNENIEKKIDEKIQHLQKVNFKLHQELLEINTNKPPAEHIQYHDRYDNVTGLPNRYYFNDILNKAINYARRRDQLLAILTIDLNQFKNVNNSIGFKRGDNILKKIGKRFISVLRTEDNLAKTDEDEFIVLLTDIGQAKFAGTVAEKLLQACRKKMIVDKDEIVITASIGISIYPDDGHSLTELTESAEAALFKAKHQAGQTNGSFQFFKKELDNHAHEYTALEKELRKAINQRELTLYYQPKFSIKRGHIAGVETLIRWEHPELGLISPAKFIPIAEESGLIMPIGEWILREACAMNKHWQDAGFEHFTIAVNLSPKQFHHPRIVEIISKILNETG